jgi:hypothetical protein
MLVTSIGKSLTYLTKNQKNFNEELFGRQNEVGAVGLWLSNLENLVWLYGL